jgi:hypothetical protein
MRMKSLRMMTRWNLTKTMIVTMRKNLTKRIVTNCLTKSLENWSLKTKNLTRWMTMRIVTMRKNLTMS